MNRFVVGLLCFAPLSLALANAGHDGQKEVSANLNPVILLQQIDVSERITVGNNIRIRIIVKNGSAGISLEEVSISPPPGLRLNYKNNIDTPIRLDIKDKETMGPGDSLDFGEIDLQGPHLSLLNKNDWSLLTYRPKKESIIGKVSYKFTGKPGNISGSALESSFSSLDIDVLANPLGIFSGAIVGTFLGVLFIAMFRIQKAIEASPASKSGFVNFMEEGIKIGGKEILRGSFIFLKAIVASGIVILILQSASGVKFPIEVSVNDFYGGLAMGLIGERIASAVYEWIIKT